MFRQRRAQRTRPHAPEAVAEPKLPCGPAAPCDRPDGTLMLRVAGLCGPLCSVSVPEGATVVEAKAAIERAVCLPASQQRLLASDEELPDEALVAAAGPPGQAVIELTLLRRSPVQADWLRAILRRSRMLCDAPESVRGDRDVVLAAISVHGGSQFQFASPELRSDRKMVLAAVAADVTALEHAPEELRGDKKMMLAAVFLSDGRALGHADDELRGDKELVLAAVSSDGRALVFAAEEARGDREVVLAAVSSHGGALRYAAEELRSDKEVVLAAVASDSSALELAAEELRGDAELVQAALASDLRATSHAAGESRGERDMLVAAGPAAVRSR